MSSANCKNTQSLMRIVLTQGCFTCVNAWCDESDGFMSRWYNDDDDDDDEKLVTAQALARNCLSQTLQV